MMVPQRKTAYDADGTDLTNKENRCTRDNQHLKNIFLWKFLFNLKNSSPKDTEAQIIMFQQIFCKR